MTCTNPAHDHSLPEEGTYTPEEVPSVDGLPVCGDCAAPIHYDTSLDQWVHDNPEAEPCFLIQYRPSGATPCAVAL